MATQTGDKSKIREKKINLAALMKLDGFAKDILDTASSVAHYQFDPTTEKWVSSCCIKFYDLFLIYPVSFHLEHSCNLRRYQPSC